MIREARAADIDALARLHAESLPSSLLTELGPAGLARFYRFAIRSPVEHLWVADVDGVVAGCVLSDEPATMTRRFVRRAPLHFAGDLGKAIIASPSLRRRLLHALRGGGEGPHSPEVTQIFTDASKRGHGLGAELLRSCEQALKARGTRSYFVHTLRDDNQAGIRFYERQGFVVIGESMSFGECFLVMQKELD